MGGHAHNHRHGGDYDDGGCADSEDTPCSDHDKRATVQRDIDDTFTSDDDDDFGGYADLLAGVDSYDNDDIEYR